MKALIFSDLHAHPFRAFADLDESGTNTRLTAVLDVLGQIGEAARANGVDVALFCGDLWEKHSPSPSAKNLIWQGLVREFSDWGIPLYLLPGNHDISRGFYRNWRDVSFASLGEGKLIHPILPAGRWYETQFDGVRIGAVPWVREQELVDTLSSAPRVDVLLVHTMVAGVTLSNGFRLSGLVDAGLLQKKAQWVFAGHIHEPMRDVNLIIPGAPMHHNFGDVGGRRVWLLDTDAERIEWLTLDSPRFITVDSTEDVNVADGDYYRVRVGAKETVSVSLPDSEDAILQYAEKQSCNSEAGLGYLRGATEETEDTVVPRGMYIEEMEIQNFLCWRDAQIVVRPGCWLLHGDNASGKSSLLESLAWVLYGRTAKGVAKDDVINWDAKSARVRVVFRADDARVEIQRRRTGSRETVSLTVDGQKRFDCGVKEAQPELTTFLGIDYNLFLQMVYFAQRGTQFFTDLTDSGRKGMVSSILNLERWSRARELVKSDHKSGTEKANRIAEKIISVDGRMHERRKVWADLNVQSETWRKDKQQRITAQLAECKRAQERLNAVDRDTTNGEAHIEMRKGDVDKLQTERRAIQEAVDIQCAEYTEVQHRVADYQRDEARIERQISSVSGQSEGDRCERCGSVISAEAKTAYCDALHVAVRDLEDHIHRVSQDMVRLDPKSAKQDLLRVSGELEEASAGLQEMMSTISHLERTQTEARLSKENGEAQLRTLRDEACPYDAMIARTKEELADLKWEKIDLRKDERACKAGLEELSLWVKAFGPEGIPALLLDDFCQVFEQQTNGLLAEYGDSLRVSISAKKTTAAGELRNRFDVCVVEHGESHPLAAASGGQMTQINFAAMIALNRLLCGRYAIDGGIFGIQMFDELFSDLDPDRLQTTRQMLDDLPSRSVLVVAHDSRLTALFDKGMEVCAGQSGSELMHS